MVLCGWNFALTLLTPMFMFLFCTGFSPLLFREPMIGTNRICFPLSQFRLGVVRLTVGNCLHLEFIFFSFFSHCSFANADNTVIVGESSVIGSHLFDDIKIRIWRRNMFVLSTGCRPSLFDVSGGLLECSDTSIGPCGSAWGKA